MSLVLFIAGSAGCTTQSKKTGHFLSSLNQPQEDPAVLHEHQQAGLLPEMRHKSLICPASPQLQCTDLQGAGQARLWQKAEKT
jgi:hypothetical protein